MRGGEHEIGCDRHPGAQAVLAYDQHDVARDRLLGRRRASDHGGGGSEDERKASASKRRDRYPAKMAHRTANRAGRKGAAGFRLACRGKPAPPSPENAENPAITAASFEAAFGLPRSARSPERSLPGTVPGIPLLLLK